jgi:replicative DNA helicase
MSFTSFKTCIELAEVFKENLKSTKKKFQNANGIPSGFEKLDAIINGFQTSNLILVGAEQGMGKTSFAVSLITKMTIENQCATSFFSLEIVAQQLLHRILSQQTNIATEQLRLGLLNEKEIELVSKSIEALQSNYLRIYDSPFLTVSDIEETILCAPASCTKLIIIDSLQSIAKSKKDKTSKVLNKRELTKITFQLKQLAVKYNITILVLVHFTLQAERLNEQLNRRPLLSDLRKHAPIDAFADLVLLLYRPEYYKIDEWDDEPKLPTAEEAEVIVAKNINGNLGKTRLQFKANILKFENIKDN